MSELAEEIGEKLEGFMNVEASFINGVSASKSRIRSEISQANLGSNDVVWYYYSGHGENYDTWPQSAQEGVPLTWVHSQLSNTPSRLTIAMYDCCTYRSPQYDPPSGIRPKSAFYKLLFLESSGNIISSSCSSGQFSYGNEVTGGLFTNSFVRCP